MKPIDINLDKLWINLNHNRLSLVDKEKMRNVHLTLSYHENCEEVNLHVTRNVKPSDNPKVEIFRFEKRIVEEILETIGCKLFKYLYRQININHYKRSKDWIYVSIDQSAHSGVFPDMERKVEPVFSFLSGNGSGRVRLTDLEVKKFLEDICIPKEEALIDNIISKIPNKVTESESGFMIFRDKITSVMCVNGKWYRRRNKLIFSDLIQELFTFETYIRLKWRFLRGVALVRLANSYEDTSSYSIDSIRLKVIKSYEVWRAV